MNFRSYVCLPEQASFLKENDAFNPLEMGYPSIFHHIHHVPHGKKTPVFIAMVPEYCSNRAFFVGFHGERRAAGFTVSCFYQYDRFV